jgi:hypothetical protein
LNVLDAFLSTGCTKSYKFERVMIVQTHTHYVENGRFFLFFQKNAVICTKLQGFFWKNEKNPPFSLSWVCLNFKQS